MHVTVRLDNGPDFKPYSGDKLETHSVRKKIEEITEGRLVDEGAYGDKDVNIIEDCYDDLHPFVAAALTAFNLHLPWRISPALFQALILDVLSQHINLNSDELRSRIVHTKEGKERLECKVNEFVRDPEIANDWQRAFANEKDGFLKQINAKIKKDPEAGVFVPEFASTSAHEKNVLAVQVMTALQTYFEYVFTTKCGFLEIIMEGDLEEWKLLRKNTEDLVKYYCLPDFASKWLHALLPTLNKLVYEYQNALSGNLGDEEWWNSFVKHGGRTGSGRSKHLCGHINIWFPFDKEGKENPFMEPFDRANAYVVEGKDKASAPGLQVQYWPSGRGTTPAKWEYYRETFPLQIHSGFFGVVQHYDGSLKAHLNWCISYERDEDYPTST